MQQKENKVHFSVSTVWLSNRCGVKSKYYSVCS